MSVLPEAGIFIVLKIGSELFLIGAVDILIDGEDSRKTLYPRDLIGNLSKHIYHVIDRARIVIGVLDLEEVHIIISPRIAAAHYHGVSIDKIFLPGLYVL